MPSKTGTLPPGLEQTGEMPGIPAQHRQPQPTLPSLAPHPQQPSLTPQQQPSLTPQHQPSLTPQHQPSLTPQQSPQMMPMPPPTHAHPHMQTMPGSMPLLQRPQTGSGPIHPPLSPQAPAVQPSTNANANQTGPQPAMSQTGVQMQHPPAPQSAPRITVQYPQIGAVLTSKRGNYTVRSTLGAGEFGAVYECVGPFDQTYAMKMIRPANRPYAEVYAEWAREVQRLMSLRHPNVVYIHDAFEQGNLFYMALERCDHPLTPMLGTPMQEGLAIELVRQLLAAVQFLHDNDIVHDDLHPGNVLVTHSSDRPVVKISDFGISHELRGAPQIRPNVVHHKIMAPEVVSSGYTSKQSDLYQVGLLLFWMVTGSPAIAPGLSYQELVKVVSEGEPRQRAEAIGTPLGELVSKMLRRRDTYRYTSAKEVWADMRELPAWQNRQLFPTK